jgi:hypothetical protein
MSARPVAFDNRHLVLIGLIVACALSRLLPHAPNFSPIEATALFAGAYFADRRLAIAVPIAAMLISDLVIGLHAGMFVVYACIAVMALAGRGLQGEAGALRIAGYGVGSAVFFFVVTNFFVWLGLSHPMYPRTLDGLVACYVAAIPFFQNTLAGVAFYSILLFGGWSLVTQRLPGMRATAA